MAEVLQGASDSADFSRLRERFQSLQFLETPLRIWERVGELAYQLSSRGLRTPMTDLTVAAVALEHDLPLFALDQHFQRIPGLKLHSVRRTKGHRSRS